jgi:hypothetical protein
LGLAVGAFVAGGALGAESAVLELTSGTRSAGSGTLYRKRVWTLILDVGTGARVPCFARLDRRRVDALFPRRNVEALEC